MRNFTFCFALVLVSSAASAAGTLEKLIPASTYSALVKEVGDIPACDLVASDSGASAGSTRTCVYTQENIRTIYVKSPGEARKSVEPPQIAYLGDAFYYKSYIISLGSVGKAEGLSAFNAVVESLSAELANTPVIARNWSSVAVDRMDKYIDMNHFLSVAREVRRWEVAKAPLLSLDWNPVVAIWKQSDQLFVQATYSWDQQMGSSITVVLEDAALCGSATGGNCAINGELRKLAAGQSDVAAPGK